LLRAPHTRKATVSAVPGFDTPAVAAPASEIVMIRGDLAHWTWQAGDTKRRLLEPGDGDAECNGRYYRSSPLDHTE
jgi:hypothetical protein